jgi:CrcB protein
MKDILLVGAAGLIGTLGRYWLSGVLDQRYGAAFPFGTLAVNLAGCFLAGLLFHTLIERFVVDPLWSATILIGLLGAFTTFSAYGLQTFVLFRNGQALLAVFNVVLSNLAGLVFVWAGYSVSKML